MIDKERADQIAKLRGVYGLADDIRERGLRIGELRACAYAPHDYVETVEQIMQEITILIDKIKQVE